jgi:hypothetical protein
MNFLPFTKTGLVSRLPLQNPRSATIKTLLYANTALFGYYYLVPGPSRRIYKRALTLEENSHPGAMLTAHFAHTSLTTLLFTSSVLYTVGNYHVLKYGSRHFWYVYGAGLLAGGLLAGINSYWNPNQTLAGGIAGSGVLIGYNVFKNPGWFRYGLNPVALLTLFTLYSLAYNDRGAFGGVAAGYIAFFMGI